jgi:hypothetical protein
MLTKTTNATDPMARLKVCVCSLQAQARRMMMETMKDHLLDIQLAVDDPHRLYYLNQSLVVLFYVVHL